jgi:hypothetical protein
MAYLSSFGNFATHSFYAKALKIKDFIFGRGVAFD